MRVVCQLQFNCVCGFAALFYLICNKHYLILLSEVYEKVNFTLDFVYKIKVQFVSKISKNH